MEIRFGRITYKSTFIRYASKKCVRNFSISVRRRAQLKSKDYPNVLLSIWHRDLRIESVTTKWGIKVLS